MNKNYKKDGGSLIAKFQGKDFSEVEDSSLAFEIISEIASLAGHSAIAEAKAAGLPRVYVRNNEILRLLPDGTEEVIADPFLNEAKSYYYHYHPTTVFHALKK